jgi:hypothetical protein
MPCLRRTGAIMTTIITYAQAKTDRATAHELLDNAEKSRVQQLADRCGRTFSAMHKHLRSECHWQPKLIIALLS